MNIALTNADYWSKVLDRTEYANAKFVMSNGGSGANERSITINMNNIGLSEQSFSVRNVEPIFQDISFTARSATVTSVNGTSNVP